MLSVKKEINKAANKVSKFVDEHQTGISLACGSVAIGTIGIATSYAVGYLRGGADVCVYAAQSITKLGTKYAPEMHAEYWKILNDHADEIELKR